MYFPSAEIRPRPELLLDAPTGSAFAPPLSGTKAIAPVGKSASTLWPSGANEVGVMLVGTCWILLGSFTSATSIPALVPRFKKAMRLPSADHTGEKSRPTSKLRRVANFRCRSVIHTSSLAEESVRLKTTKLPSGEICGQTPE